MSEDMRDPTEAAMPGMGIGNSPILQSISQMLIQHGGLRGLTERFQLLGIGDIIRSWIIKKNPQPISHQQIFEIMGSEELKTLAKQMDISAETLAQQLSQTLPSVIDRLTPNYVIPKQPIGQAQVVNAVREVWEHALH